MPEMTPFVKIITPNVIYVPKASGKVTVLWHTYSNYSIGKNDVEVSLDGTAQKPEVIKNNNNKNQTNGLNGQQLWGLTFDYQNKSEIKLIIKIYKNGLIVADGVKEVLIKMALDQSRNLSNKTLDYPYVLLPLRIESKRTLDASSNSALQVRVYPDDIMIHHHHPKANEAEMGALVRYKTSTNESNKLEIWRSMARRFGPQRAAWLVNNPQIQVDSVPDEDIIARWVLPKRFWVFIFDVRQKRIVRYQPFENVVKDDLQIKLSLADNGFPKWMTDFGAACVEGMGTVITISQGKPLPAESRLIVIGDCDFDAIHGAAALENLFVGHHYSKSLAFLPIGTPTNNTQQSRSGYSQTSEDLETAYETEVVGPALWDALLKKDTAHPMIAKVLGNALGLNPEIFRNIQGATDREPSLAIEMQKVLWPAIAEPFLKDQLNLSDYHIASIYNHYLEFLSPEGPLPAIRVGNQPYGILPISNISSGFSDIDYSDNFSYSKIYNSSEAVRMKGTLEGRIDIWIFEGEPKNGIQVSIRKLGKTTQTRVNDGYFIFDKIEDSVDVVDLWVEAPGLKRPKIYRNVKVGYGQVSIFIAESYNSFDTAFPNLLLELYQHWLSLANVPEAVPQINDLSSDQMFTETLRMQPFSVEESYGIRPMINKENVAGILEAIQDYAYLDPNKKSSPYADLKAWDDQWRTIGEETDKLADAWGNTVEILHNFYAWIEKSNEEIDLFDKENGPEADIKGILNIFESIDNKTEVTGSLFYKFIIIAIKRILDKKNKSLISIEDFKSSLNNLLYLDVISFFNFVSSAEQIITISQNSLINLKKKAKVAGLTNQIAAKIITARNKLSERRFTSFEQLQALVDTETLHDLSESLAYEKYKHFNLQEKSFQFFYKQENAPDLSRLFRATLDTWSHRLDDWMTSLASRRLKALRQNKSTGVYVGAYGWSDSLYQKPNVFPNTYKHTPSRGQAAAAAVLYNAYLSHPNDGIEHPFRINLNSERTSQGLFLVDGVRQGQPLGALLGYQFERALHEKGLDEYIDNFRDKFPWHSTEGIDPNAASIAARNVVDGLALAQNWNKTKSLDIFELRPGTNKTAIARELNHLVNGLDAVADLLTYESVYHTSQGNFDRASAALEAAAGRTAPPEIQSVQTPWQGNQLGHRVCMLFPYVKEVEMPPNVILTSPRTMAEPRIAAWAEKIFWNANYIACEYTTTNLSVANTGVITLEKLGLGAIDLIYLSDIMPTDGETELERRIRYKIREKYPDGSISIDYQYKNDIPLSSEKAFSFEEALILAKQIRQLLGAGTPLRPETMALPSAGIKGLQPGDVDILSKRFSYLIRDVEKLLVDISALTKFLNLSNADNAKLLGLLQRASRYGINGSVPESPKEAVLLLLQRAANVIAELKKRIAASASEISKIAQDTTSSIQVEYYIQAIKALLGKNMVVLPSFTLALKQESTGQENAVWSVGKQLSPPQAGAVLTTAQVRGWLQQSALLYKPLQELEDTMMLAEALNKKAHGGLQLKATQLPFNNANEPWLALQAGKEQKDRFGRVVIATVLTGDIDSTKPFAGMLLHQWEEFLPADSLMTTAAFHYNAPSTQAPQSILLAVPGQTGRDWLIEDLAHMVNDTMDLAKVRAVDVEALRSSENNNFFKILQNLPLTFIDSKNMPINDEFLFKSLSSTKEMTHYSFEEGIIDNENIQCNFNIKNKKISVAGKGLCKETNYKTYDKVGNICQEPNFGIVETILNSHKFSIKNIPPSIKAIRIESSVLPIHDWDPFTKNTCVDPQKLLENFSYHLNRTTFPIIWCELSNKCYKTNPNMEEYTAPIINIWIYTDGRSEVNFEFNPLINFSYIGPVFFKFLFLET